MSLADLPNSKGKGGRNRRDANETYQSHVVSPSNMAAPVFSKNRFRNKHDEQTAVKDADLYGAMIMSPTSADKIPTNHKASIETNEGFKGGIVKNSKIDGDTRAITRAEEDSILRGGRSNSNYTSNRTINEQKHS